MKFRDFEKHMQQELSGHPSPMDTDAFYAGLQERRRRRGGLWLWFGGALLLTAVLGWGLWAELPGSEKVPKGALQKYKGENIQEKTYISDSKSVPEVKTDFQDTRKSTPETRPSLTARDDEHVTQTTFVLESRNGADVPGNAEKTPPHSQSAYSPLPAARPEEVVLPRIALPLPHWSGSRDLPFLPAVPPSYSTNAGRDFSFGLDLDVGLLSANRDLTARSPQYESLEEVRDLTEKSLETLQLGLLGRISHRSGLYLRAGASYTRIAERFDFDWTQTRKDSIENGIQEIIIFPNGDTTFVEGMVQVEIQESYRKRHHNYHHLIDVPVILGYSFGRGPLGIDVEGGVFLNLSLRSTGEIWGAGDTPIVIENEEPAPFRKSLGISYYGSFRLRYEASPSLRLYLGPQLRYFPSEFSAEGYPLRQEYQLFGLQAGAAYLFD